MLPLHLASGLGGEAAVGLLLKAAPAAALTAASDGSLPLHIAARNGNSEAVPLLLGAAPEAAATEAAGKLPADVALDQATRFAGGEDGGWFFEAARRMLPATPPDRALSALERAGEVALPLFADLVMPTALSPAQWQRVPAPCAGLGAVLPAVLARSEAETALLVGRLPAEVRQRLRIGALCLGQAQKVRRTELPAALVGQVLALATGD